ncbi:hypothetical protein N7517_006220 [Penicillium concentricum]|uniref:Uncharacterized protein n=1 Tax=Penicillium concentricum TaxID=293559 RepID=A0A9W9VB48_9EURO|nr:uncharacterized protein N7517_006220 [Penicillium concentricum]KAJ5374214.1 hypothetical protein N7517_006220 [Penicillium concentricum]
MNMIDLIYKLAATSDLHLFKPKAAVRPPLHENISRCNNSIAIEEQQPCNPCQSQQTSARDVITTNEHREP